MGEYIRPVTFDAVVIYDAECPYCTAATKALRRIDGLGAVSWEEEAAQSFLEAQFGDVPFAVTLVDVEEGTVYVGRSAAGELAERAGMPNLVSEIVTEEFDRIERVVGRAARRDRPVDDFHGEYELTDAAREAFDDLSYHAWRLPGQ